MPFTKEQYAAKALRNAATRAFNHLAHGNIRLAAKAMEAGAKTALAWLDGTHKEISKAVTAP